ncbi:amino acid permease [Kutzneria sp. 744]|uniref:amino acid permease n=1 Tax=Kutzneria sp. (strain 744) TaxID=345341 RepID=UPI0003EEC6DB|nr:amino acid permease [Kutzneria sp. 744]
MVIGLGSMIGAGLLIGLAVAALVAYCNATASAQPAAAHPTSGGTYIYGQERLGEWWGSTAGWGFVVDKSASCAAMALTFVSHAVSGPSWAQRVVAVVAVLGLAVLNYRGVARTAQLTRMLVACSLLTLVRQPVRPVIRR